MGTRTVYVVDQTGATFVFPSRRKAEKFLIAEAWRGAQHLVIVQAEVPRALSGTDLADWCVSNAPIPAPECDW